MQRGKMQRRFRMAGVAAGAAVLCATSAWAADGKAAKDPHARGRYLVVIGGCNDCHTPGYAESGGKLPEKQWLVGASLGWHGPWGTTYPINLRNYIHALSEGEWVDKARHLKGRPPMPYWVLNQMTDSDLRALYRFVHALGPAGEEAPPFVPPGQQPQGPVVTFPAPPK